MAVARIQAPRSGSKLRIVVLDSEVWRTTSAAVIRELDLHDGDHVVPEALGAAMDDVEVRRAREAALRLLSHRERSSYELLARLADDGYPARVAADTVARLEESLLVDDRRFAEAFVRGAVEGRGLGRLRILQSLARAGVDPELAEEAADEAAPVWSETDRALELASRLAARVPDRRLLAARLIRRGFAPDVAADAARRALDPES